MNPLHVKPKHNRFVIVNVWAESNGSFEQNANAETWYYYYCIISYLLFVFRILCLYIYIYCFRILFVFYYWVSVSLTTTFYGWRPKRNEMISYVGAWYTWITTSICTWDKVTKIRCFGHKFFGWHTLIYNV